MLGAVQDDTLVDAAIFREWLTGIGRRLAYGRIAHLFCEMYTRLKAMNLASAHCCKWLFTQVDMADALRLSNVHVNRTLHEMRGEELITLRGNTLVIQDWNELLRAAEFDATYLHLRKRVVR